MWAFFSLEILQAEAGKWLMFLIFFCRQEFVLFLYNYVLFVNLQAGNILCSTAVPHRNGETDHHLLRQNGKIFAGHGCKKKIVLCF